MMIVSMTTQRGTAFVSQITLNIKNTSDYYPSTQNIKNNSITFCPMTKHDGDCGGGGPTFGDGIMHIFVM